MLREAIEKIESMVKPTMVEVDGHTYMVNNIGNTIEVIPEPEAVSTEPLHSLDAVVKFVKREAIGMTGDKPLFITIPDHKTVLCEAHMDGKENRYHRNLFYKARATDVPGWEEEVSLDFERAIIALRTRFQPTPDTEYGLMLLSSITSGAQVIYKDNGMASTITTTKGVAMQEQTKVRPVITLRPYRTFQEVEQPESQFLIRISERGIKFIEADGGMWKLKARNSVKNFLEDAFQSEIESGKIVVTL